MVVIDLDDKDDAQVIFETLNARGTPLLASDLVKNYLLQQAQARGHQLDQLYAQTWEAFDSAHFWRELLRTGRFTRPHIEVFLQHYLTLLTQDEVLVTSLFNIFRQHVKLHPAVDPAHYLAELRRYGQVYYSFFHFPPDTPEGLFFQRMSVLDTTTMFPLLLQIFDALGRPAFDKQRRAILADLESFVVRRVICELTPKNYNNLFLNASKLLAVTPPDQYGAALRMFLLAQDSDIGRWPTDDELRDAWRSLQAYRRLKPQTRVRMILEALERQLRSSGLSEELNLPKKTISIEHIMPQGWRSKWPLTDDIPEAKETRDALVHSFGNLTLVTGRLNSTLRDDIWLKKRKTIKKSTVLLLNTELVEADDWDERAIRRRGDDLFKLAKKVWSRPA